MSAPPLSVVIASVNGFPYLGECLDSLERHAPDAEVIVADWTDEATRTRVRKGWPAARLISFEEPTTVPELRAAGIAAARADAVAVLEDHCALSDDRWARRLLAAHAEGAGAVGGPVRNAATRRVRDWAAFLCEYSHFTEPVERGPTEALVGMNVSYSRPAIEAMGPLLAEGRWETWLHPHLVRSGFQLLCEPEAPVDHLKHFGIREFASQRYHYARSHAGMRNPELGARRIVYFFGSPLIVPLMYSRIARSVMRKARHRRELILATPLILAYTGIWAVGEAVGYALGGGRSLLKVK